MRNTLVILLLSFTISSHAQSAYPAELRTISSFTIGDSAVKYKNTIACADNGKLDKPYSDELKCWGYRYLAQPGDSFVIGGIRFTDVVLMTDGKITIASLLYMKTLMSTDSLPREREIKNDYARLTSFLSGLFNQSGKKKKYPTDKGHIQKGLTWKAGDYEVLLEESFNRTPVKGKKLCLLSIFLNKPPNI